MKRLTRDAVLTAQVAVACLLAVGTARADVYDTPGAFASYSLTSRTADIVTQSGTDWLSASGSTRFLTYQPANPYVGEGTASVAARGAIGWAQGGVSASGTGFTTYAWGGWTDQVAVNASGLDGTHGTLTFSLAYDWAMPTSSAQMLDTSKPAFSGADVFADVNLRALGAAESTRQYQYAEHIASTSCDGFGPCQASDDWMGTALVGSQVLDDSHAPTFSAGLVTYTLDIVFGQSYFLTIGMNGSVTGQNGSASTDPLNSLAWAGLYSVRDSNGQLIDPNAVGMSSALGFDFSQAVTPVPEPTSLMLMAAGLAAIIGMRRYRRR